MTTITLQISDHLKDVADKKAESGGFHSLNEFFEALLLDIEKKSAKQELEALLLQRVEAMENGDCSEITPEYWTNLRHKLIEKHGKKQAS